MAALKNRPQLGLLEAVVGNTELANQLDEWQEAREDLKPHAKRFRLLNQQVKQAIEDLDLANGDYRCGSFTITIGTPESKHIEFERASKISIRIKPAKDEDD